ncbi:sugar (Glycoside-Pentoside-Hexuronide) transporter [Acidaminococcus sp. CAG:917]|nr:sugar (Glycoside-Pentoside-Hexuronide) transporter [Acidaminococcus sp. CAG:917]
MDGGGVALMACVLLKYMTDTLLIASAAASTIMLISKIWDAITDPIMGYISDNTRSKFGRRKPYMFIGGISLIIALFLLFAPIREWGITDQAGLIAWMLIFYMVWNTCSTCSQVPYTSMASDISPSFKERNNANTIKVVFVAAASGIAYLVPLLLLNAMQDVDNPTLSPTAFWLIIASLFGLLFGGGLVICAFGTKERIKPAPHEAKVKFNFKEFLKGYITPYKNKSYAWHIGMYVSAFTCMDMLSALAAFYADHVWRNTIVDLGFMTMKFSSMFVVAPLMVAAVIAFPLVRWVMDKKGKGFAFRMGLPFYIIGGILIAVLDPAWCPPLVIPFVAFIMGFGFGGAQMIPWMIFPDTLDICELATGERPTGNYSGMMTLIRKVAGALGVGLIGWILTGVGYDTYIANINNGISNAPALTANVVLTIRLLMGIAVTVLIAFAFFAACNFRLNNKVLARVRYLSDKVKTGQYDSLTEEEKQERIDLIQKHYGKYNAEKDMEMIQIYKEHPVLPEEETPKEVIAEVDKIEQIDPVVSDSVQDDANSADKAVKFKKGKNQEKETAETEIKGNDSSDEN